MSYFSDARLDEQDLATNFNPPGAPFNGITDSDQTDDYSSEIQGLAHVRGQLLMTQSAEIDGIVGVVTNGLFSRRPADLLLVAGAGGVERI